MTPEIFKIEVLPMKHKLFRFASRLLNDSQEAQDVVQEVLLKLWAMRSRLNEYRSLDAFAMTVTKNLCLDKLKSKWNKTEKLNALHDLRSELNPQSNMELNETTRHIHELIGRLPEQQRMIIHLRDVEGYEFSEIAAILGISENTIRVNLSRARMKVRESMIKTYQYEVTKN